MYRRECTNKQSWPLNGGGKHSVFRLAPGSLAFVCFLRWVSWKVCLFLPCGWAVITYILLSTAWFTQPDIMWDFSSQTLTRSCNYNTMSRGRLLITHSRGRKNRHPHFQVSHKGLILPTPKDTGGFTGVLVYETHLCQVSFVCLFFIDQQ